MSHENPQPVVSIRDLSVVFSTSEGDVEAVRNINMDINAGETVAVVGESGSGKSTLAACINRLLADNGRIASGTILLDGIDITRLSEREMVALRGRRVGLVPQDPMTSLNPIMKVGAQIVEALTVHDLARGAEAKSRAITLLEAAGIRDAEARFDQYPHEFSGGMRQRVLIAMALACQPQLLLADEPTSALDVTVQRLVLDQMAKLTTDLGTAVLLITHDLALAAERSDRVAVMFRGEIVEMGPAKQVISAPQHEYTRRLLSAAPSMASTKVAPAVVRESLSAANDDLLTLTGAVKKYRLRGRDEPFLAVNQVSLSIPAGQTVAIVGESGSGKSTTARLVLKLEHLDAGQLTFKGDDVSSLKSAKLAEFRRSVQPVFQNPYASLDPRFSIHDVITEPLAVHKIGDKASRRRVALELLDKVALPATFASRYPHELSGGQRQRVAIARALALDPRIVVMDEAVSALDVLVQEQILDLMVELQKELGLSYLFISHDLAVVRLVSHFVYVMRAGQVVESGEPDQIFDHPQEDYTRELIAAIPGGMAQLV